MCSFGPSPHRAVCLTEVVRRRILLSFASSIHGRFSFQQGLPLWPQQWSADGHAAAKPSGSSTFLEASSRPHEEKEGIPYRSVKRRGGPVSMCAGPDRKHTQILSGQVTSDASKKRWDGNHYQNSCLPVIVSPLCVCICEREGMHVILSLKCNCISCLSDCS